MTEFIAQLLWVAVGDYYAEHWPMPDDQYRLLCDAQFQLETILAWGSP